MFQMLMRLLNEPVSPTLTLNPHDVSSLQCAALDVNGKDDAHVVQHMPRMSIHLPDMAGVGVIPCIIFVSLITSIFCREPGS